MKHIALMTIAILYLIFNVIQLDTIHDNDKINNRKALEILVGESGADFVNSVASNPILNNYQQKLYKEANFDETKRFSTGKEGFKKPYLFMLFLKDCGILFLKLLMFYITIKVLFIIYRSISQRRKNKLQIAN